MKKGISSRIQIMMQRHFNNIYSSKPLFKFEKIYEGKVRTIYDNDLIF